MATLEERNALAAEMFPVEWKRCATKTGEQARRRRHNLRARADAELVLIALRERGAKCENCDSFSRKEAGHKNVCLADTDFYGYAIVKPDGLCTRWGERIGL